VEDALRAYGGPEYRRMKMSMVNVEQAKRYAVDIAVSEVKAGK
jgi:hypothetical protein